MPGSAVDYGDGYTDSIDDSCSLLPDSWAQGDEIAGIGVRNRLEDLQTRSSKLNWELAETESPGEQVKVKVKGKKKGTWKEKIYTGTSGTKEYTYYAWLADGARGKEVIQRKMRVEYTFAAKVAEKVAQEYLKFDFPFNNTRIESYIYTYYDYYPDARVAREAVVRFDPACIAIGRMNMPYTFGKNKPYVPLTLDLIKTSLVVREYIYDYNYKRSTTARYELPLNTISGQLAVENSGSERVTLEEVQDLIGQVISADLVLVDYDVATNTSNRDDVPTRPKSVERAAAAYGRGRSGGNRMAVGFPAKTVESEMEMLGTSESSIASQVKSFVLAYAGDDYIKDARQVGLAAWTSSKESRCESNMTVQSIQSRTVITDIVQKLGLPTPDGVDLLESRFTKTEFELDRPLVDVLDDLLISESKIGYVDENGVLRIVPIAIDKYDNTESDTTRFHTSGPLLDLVNIISAGPINTGDLPATKVRVEYDNWKMTKNPPILQRYREGEPPAPKYIRQTGTAEQQARELGEMQNRMLMGHRQGISMVLPEGKVPTTPMQPFYVQGTNDQGNQTRGMYRVNGRTVKFNADGLVVSLDAMFWGGVGQA